MTIAQRTDIAIWFAVGVDVLFGIARNRVATCTACALGGSAASARMATCHE